MAGSLGENAFGDPSPEHAAFRTEVCAFLRDVVAPRLEAERDPSQLGGVTSRFRRELMQLLGEQGFFGMGWPVEYGGGGKDLYYDLILVDEMEYHGAPPVEPSYLYVADTLIAHGTEEQKQDLLPRLRRGEISITVGYSEPEAGSDLANLSAMAQPVDGGFRLSGEKVYQSFASTADYSLVVARTSPRTEKKHQGVSLLLVDMHAPGVTVREHQTMAGYVLASVRFDEVFIPATAVVGPVGKAWRVVMSAIAYERAMLGSSGQSARQVDLQIDSMTNGVWDPALADELIRCAIDAEASSIYSRSLASRMRFGEDLSDESGVSMLLKREAVRRIEVAGIEASQAHGDAIPLTGGREDADGSAWREYLGDFVYEFSAGGFDVTRNVIAQRMLGLPR